MPSKNYVHALNPRSYGTLFGKRFFVDVIKWRISRWDSHGLSRYTLNSMPHVLLRDREERRQTGEGHVKTELEIRDMQPHAKESLEPPEGRRCKVGSFSTPFSESFVLLAPVLQLWNKMSDTFKLPPFWWFDSKA